MRNLKFFIYIFCFIFSVNGFSLLAQTDYYYEILHFVKGGRETAVLSRHVVVRLKPEYTLSGISAIKNGYVRLSAMEPLLRPEASLTHNNDLRKNNFLLTSNKAIEIIRAEEPLLRTFIFEYFSELSPEVFCKQLKKDEPAIEIAEPYFVYPLLATPNDSLALQQSVLYKINAFDAWNHTQGDTSVIIGISDNGVLQTHEDLNPNIARNWGEIPGDGIDNDGNGYVDDFIGYNMTYRTDGTDPGDTYNDSMLHGTAIAGMAAAATNNYRGIAGVAYNCRFFPIKASKIHDTAILMGYQSITYAAIRGCKVLNLSWGQPKPYSEIDQSVIDFAIARDVAIVAAGGNLNSVDGATIESSFYPAGYRGVLGVGTVDQNDNVTNNSILGPPVRIMAPGANNYAPSNIRNGYTRLSDGTSFASPIVAGGVALIRSKYPNLSAVQALEFTRQCTDNITLLNPAYASILPGRLNLLKAMTKDPFSIPSFVHTGTEYRTESGLLTDRFLPGEKAVMNIKVKNELGAATNLRFALSVGYDMSGAVEVLDSVVNVSSVQSGEEILLQSFSFRITDNSTSKMLFRLEITGDNGYRDFFKIPFTPTLDVTTFSNDAISFSLSDNGNFGFNNSQQNKLGVGFTLKGIGNQLYEGGLMAAVNSMRAVSANYGTYFTGNDFTVIKPFVQPNRNIGIVRDDRSESPIGLAITQTVFMSKNNDKWAKIKLTLKNMTGFELRDPAVGYFKDWDIGGNSSRNQVRLLPEAIPISKVGAHSAAEMALINDDFPVFGSAVYSEETGAVAQAAGLHFGITGYFSLSDQIKALYSGTSWQTDTTYDISYVVGMRYPGTLLPNEEKNCWVCVAAGESREELAEQLRNCLDIEVSVNTVKVTEDILVYPQPARGFISIVGEFASSSVECTVYNLLGEQVFRTEIMPDISNAKLNLDLKGLSAGVYYLRLKDGNRLVTKQIIIYF